MSTSLGGAFVLPLLPMTTELPMADGPPPRERADAARNRAKVLAAAERLFADGDPTAVTMDDIARAALRSAAARSTAATPTAPRSPAPCSTSTNAPCRNGCCAATRRSAPATRPPGRAPPRRSG